MKLRRSAQEWDQLAVSDPWRAILGRPGAGEPWNPEEFFATGVAEVAALMHYLASLQLPARRRTALDFGCGAGRVTQALAAEFAQVYGVDIAPRMLELANRYNRHGERCRYVLNREASLRIFAGQSMDFIYSNITLQHIRPRLVKAYLAEFLRLLAPGGVMVFHMPSHRVKPFWVRLLPGWLSSYGGRLIRHAQHPGKPVIAMYGMRKRRVVRWLETHGGRVVDVERQDAAGPEWIGYRYAVTR